MFEGLRAGEYEITAARTAYARRSYGEPDSGVGGDRIVALGRGESRRGLDIPLSPGGGIAGRVTDAAGAPITDVMMNVEPLSPMNAPRIASTIVVRTTASGDYTLPDLPVGAYRVTARWVDPERMRARAAIGNTLTYFPGTIDREQATAVRVVAGETTGGVDIRLARPSPLRLRGHVIRGSVDGPIEAVLIAGGVSSRTVTLSSDGAFELTHLAPGRYTLWARTRHEALIEAAVISVDLQDEVNGLTIPMLPTGTIEGRVVTVDGATPPEGTVQVVAALQDEGRDVDPLPRDRVLIGSDGLFTIAGVFGERALRVTDPGGEWQVDRVRQGRNDVRTIAIASGVTVRDVTIVVSRR